MTDLVLVVHNVRSAHNVGSLLRTADGLGVQQVWLTGYTPYPHHNRDERLPHVALRADKQIAKTALGAEKSVKWQQSTDILPVLDELKSSGFKVAALEQAYGSVKLPGFAPPSKLAIIVGREVDGLEAEIIGAADFTFEIPMSGQKESFNVVQAAAMALYHCRFAP